MYYQFPEYNEVVMSFSKKQPVEITPLDGGPEEQLWLELLNAPGASGSRLIGGTINGRSVAGMLGPLGVVNMVPVSIDLSGNPLRLSVGDYAQVQREIRAAA